VLDFLVLSLPLCAALLCADWDDKLQDAVRESFEADNAEQAYGSIRSMLASLDDPFTRIVTPRVCVSLVSGQNLMSTAVFAVCWRRSMLASSTVQYSAVVLYCTVLY